MGWLAKVSNLVIILTKVGPEFELITSHFLCAPGGRSRRFRCDSDYARAVLVSQLSRVPTDLSTMRSGELPSGS